MPTGYAHPDYAKALAEYGTPRALPRCGGWLLERPIPGFPYRDAMGCYPLFVCRDWSQLKADLEDLASEFVCVSLVTDPFGDYTRDQLHACFPDRVIPFKEHYVLDMQQPVEHVVKRRTRQAIRRALTQIDVQICLNPLDFLDDWVRLYQHLISIHNLSGIHAFSRRSFERQVVVPGLVMFRAAHEGRIEGLSTWYMQGNVASGHLMAVSDVGYELGAGYALHWRAIQHFTGKVRWLNFTGVPGRCDDPQSHVAVFKRKWASGTRTTYFCGRIFHRALYDQIVRANGASDDGYFPAYRAGEFR